MLLVVVGSIVDSTTVRKGVMHGQLLLQITDLLLEAFDLESRVEHRVDSSLISDFHHTRSELQSGGSLTQVTRLRPDIRDHDSLAVAADGVTEEVGQLSLTVWDVTALLAAQGKDDLLEETK